MVLQMTRLSKTKSAIFTFLNAHNFEKVRGHTVFALFVCLFHIGFITLYRVYNYKISQKVFELEL